jgi:hypothetical protein
MTQLVGPNSYATAVIALYLEQPDTPMRASQADQAVARRLEKDGVRQETVEAALLLGSLRRLLRPKEAAPLSPIRSLAYFLPVIEELTQNPSPGNYLDYLRLKLQQTIKSGSVAGQKTTFSDGR